MKNSFLSQSYVALALIKAKSQIFNEGFVTTSELNQFIIYMQREFNKRDLNIVIVNELNPEDFSIKDGIVTITDNCCYDLNSLSYKVLNVLTDVSLILDFFMKLEKEKIKTLEKLQTNILEANVENQALFRTIKNIWSYKCNEFTK